MADDITRKVRLVMSPGKNAMVVLGVTGNRSKKTSKGEFRVETYFSPAMLERHEIGPNFIIQKEIKKSWGITLVISESTFHGVPNAMFKRGDRETFGLIRVPFAAFHQLATSDAGTLATIKMGHDFKYHESQQMTFHRAYASDPLTEEDFKSLTDESKISFAFDYPLPSRLSFDATSTKPESSALLTTFLHLTSGYYTRPDLSINNMDVGQVFQALKKVGSNGSDSDMPKLRGHTGRCLDNTLDFIEQMSVGAPPIQEAAVATSATMQSLQVNLETLKKEEKAIRATLEAKRAEIRKVEHAVARENARIHGIEAPPNDQPEGVPKKSQTKVSFAPFWEESSSQSIVDDAWGISKPSYAPGSGGYGRPSGRKTLVRKGDDLGAGNINADEGADHTGNGSAIGGAGAGEGGGGDGGIPRDDTFWAPEPLPHHDQTRQLSLSPIPIQPPSKKQKTPDHDEDCCVLIRVETKQEREEYCNLIDDDP